MTRCLYGIKDDLHEYAEGVLARLPALLTAPCASPDDFGPVVSVVLERRGQFQTELVRMAAGLEVPPHRHPGVDTIECTLEGTIRFWLAGKDPFERVSDERLMRFARGKMMRIQADTWHHAKSGPEGCRLISMQRWAPHLTLGALGERWEGKTVSSAHERRAKEFEGKLVPITAAIAEQFLGRAPARAVRGYAYLEGGRPLVIFGLERYEDGWLLFSNRRPEVEGGTVRARRLIALGLRRLTTAMREARAPIYADADQRYKGACELLERMGFHRQTDGRFKWQG